MGSVKSEIFRILVTGGSKGVGFETARDLARKGHSLIVTSRSFDRATAAADLIQRETGNAQVAGFRLNLARLTDVRQFHENVRANTDQVDVLINNAGIIPQKWTASEDGFEMQFAVNYLAHFLLTNLLLADSEFEPLKRIVNVTSQVHSRLPLDLEDLDSKLIDYDRIDVYSRSKLAMIYFTLELAKRLSGLDTVTNCVHPGVLKTDLLSDYYGRNKIMRHFRSVSGDAPSEGAGPLARLAIDTDFSAVTGQYFHKYENREPTLLNPEKDFGASLWQRSSELCRLDGA